MRVLALDLARKTGWALGTVHDAVPESGSITITNEGASMGKLFSSWRLYLRDFLSLHPDIRVVVFESPLPPMHKAGDTNISTIRRLMGLAAVTEELLYTYNAQDRRNAPYTPIDIREARVSDVRSYFIGSNRHKRDEAKELTKKQCRLLGWKPVDDNAADALALWDYQRAILMKQDLFRRGA
jgi:hypothetical protein